MAGRTALLFASLFSMFSDVLAGSVCYRNLYSFYCEEGCCSYYSSYSSSYYVSCCDSSSGTTLYIALGVTAGVIILFAAVFCGLAHYLKHKKAQEGRVRPAASNPQPAAVGSVVHAPPQPVQHPPPPAPLPPPYGASNPAYPPPPAYPYGAGPAPY